MSSSFDGPQREGALGTLDLDGIIGLPGAKGAIAFSAAAMFAVVLSGMAPNTLSARLKSLTAQGVIARRFYEEHPPRAEYHLTDKGRALGPVLKALYKWGEEFG